ncbi:MAG: hypothetical protein PS018_11590 [bacterium]|nr:hypothetical protein [bacterium]
MPSIADQVAQLELDLHAAQHDLAAALARIDALTSENQAYSLANASLRTDNADAHAKINDMQQYVDATRDMVQNLATSANEMLRVSRRQIGPVVEVKTTVVPFMVPGPDGVTGVPFKPEPGSIIYTGEIYKLDQDAGNANALASDSGDEQPTRSMSQGGPTIVAHDDNDLPIFLKSPFLEQRGQVFA